jgi:ADP-ribosyl-[dinitrogen reductase] hydrolase
MITKTSLSHPIQIDTLTLDTGGRIGMIFCPGKYQPHGLSGAWDRDLTTDLQAIVDWGARVLVTLMEAHELQALKVAGMGQACDRIGLAWFHLPIRDMSVPGTTFEADWQRAGAHLHTLLDRGEGIVVHCKGGLGRTGVIAARLLIERGESPDSALRKVRAARAGTVENAVQEDYVCEFGRHTILT